ncbi:hypothetical protein LguiA_007882 [Lonicera macranthoides]
MQLIILYLFLHYINQWARLSRIQILPPKHNFKYYDAKAEDISLHRDVGATKQFGGHISWSSL